MSLDLLFTLFPKLLLKPAQFPLTAIQRCLKRTEPRANLQQRTLRRLHAAFSVHLGLHQFQPAAACRQQPADDYAKHHTD